VVVVIVVVVVVVVKSTATPVHACTGPERSRNFRLPDAMTIGT